MLSKPKQESPESPMGTQGSDSLIKRQLLQEEKKKIKEQAKAAILLVQNEFLLL